MSKTFDVAVVGATGAVGETMLSILAERKFPVGEVYALASSRSAGKSVEFGNKLLTVQDLADFDFCMHLKRLRRAAWSSITPRSFAMTMTYRW